MISKELLNKIYSECDLNIWFSFIESYNRFTQEDLEEVDINIYELAHRCKMWAHSNGYMLNTVILTADNKTWYCEDDYNKTRTTWKDDSEVLVIFKACEWILEEINKYNKHLKFIKGNNI